MGLKNFFLNERHSIHGVIKRGNLREAWHKIRFDTNAKQYKKCKNINGTVYDHLVTAGLEMRVRDGDRMDHDDDSGFSCVMMIGRAI